MSPQLSFRQRPVGFVFWLVCAFALGVLIERSGRLLAPFHYAPAGVEKTFAPFWETWYLVDKHFVHRPAVNPQKMTQGAIRGLLYSLGDDGHTRYVTPEELKGLKEELEGHMEGIGASLRIRAGQPTIVYTLPGSPARTSGLRPGDVILEVNDTQASTMPLEQIVSLVRGKAGTIVKLHIARSGQSKPLEFSIARAEVKVPDVAWAMLPGVPIAHVALRNFGEKASDQVKAAVEGALQRGARALILDLRGNPGGIKDQAVAVTSQFLKSGNVFLEQDAAGNQKPVAVMLGGIAQDIPLAVLIDGGTASSGEICAGALQDHGRGKLIGTTTIGTGTVLEPFGLSDGSAVLLAVSQWLTPNGRQIWHKGISPDIAVTLPKDASVVLPDQEAELTAAALSKSQDKQLLKALEVLREQVQPQSEAKTKK